MDALSSLYGLTGTSDPAHLAVSVIIAFVLAGGLASVLLETVRIVREYSAPATPAGMPAPAAQPAAKPMAAKAVEVPKEKPLVKVPVKAPVKAPEKAAEKPSVPAIDVVKGSLKESIEVLEKKYRLNAVTLATVDGLVIASTINDPDEEAAVWSGKFNELNKDKPGNYYGMADKGVYLYSAESAGNKVIGVARRTSALEQGEIAGLQEDTRKIVDKFAPAVKKP